MSTPDTTEQLQFVFVHGFQGWGSYDKRNQKLPYWGMRGGDLMAWLQEKGYHAYAASVSPDGSTWDRACELYAQLTGTKVDYGALHSKENSHERFGRDFTGQPLIPSFDENTKLVLIGHSFGGATANLFAELMANGDAREREVTAAEDLSPLFCGGMGERVRCLVALAAGQNGNSSYEMPDGYQLSGDAKLPWWSKLAAARFAKATQRKAGSTRNPRDCAEYDMHLDAARALNQRISILPHVLYLSVPCSYTQKNAAGHYVPEKGMTPFFLVNSAKMGQFSGTTEGGCTIDERWWENDGRVNTISETAPFGAPQAPLDRENLQAGVWNVFPTYHGDHMSLVGGLIKQHDIRGFYEDLLTLVTSFEESRS